jgi:PAS domain S-box-containing protein
MNPDNPPAVETPDRFAQLIGAIADYAIYTLDPAGRIDSWNAGAEKLFGWSAAETIGQPYRMLFSPDDQAAAFPEETLDHVARHGHHEAPAWRVRKNGEHFLCQKVMQASRDAQGEVIGYAVIIREIREVFDSSERTLRTLIEGVVDYALFMLDPNGIVSSWNPGAERLKGYKAEEIVGRHFSRFYTDADREAGAPQRALSIAAAEGRFEAEGWRVRKDGTPFWANVVIDAIRDESGALVGFAKITRDITERREAQLALEEAQMQRAHAQKMDALGQLTGGVAHDFNNLLMVVNGHLHVLKSRLGGDPRLARSLDAIEAAARQGSSLTRQLLAFSRRQPSNPTVIEPAVHIETVRSMLTGVLPGSIAFTVSIAPDIWPIKVDAGELELALVNLFLNARDAMPRGGSLSLTAENVILHRDDTAAEIEGEFVGLRIADSGSGIPPDILERIFEPFFTTKPLDKGTGLGLSQVYGFAHQSGGTLTVDSMVGQGTAVTLYLPRTHETAREAQVSEALASQGGSILLVEDNPEVAEVTTAMLDQAGYAVQQVPNADAALETLETRRFDLVISDITMPGSHDGLALARKLRRISPRLPVLLVTGYSSRAVEAAGEFPVLRKPFQPQQLGQAVARAMHTVQTA